MFIVQEDLRIFMTPVTEYDRTTRAWRIAPDGKERVFEDSGELVKFLARHTKTFGYADPARWVNSVIDRQAAIGRPARTWVAMEGWYSVKDAHWYGRIEETWDWWFHDAGGRTVDARLFLPDVTAAVLHGDTGDVQSAPRFFFSPGRRKHRGHRGGRVGFYIHGIVPEDLYDDEGSFIAKWEPRGKLKTTARDVSDWDWFEHRARRGTGWKEHKYTRQWEHNVREREKHDRNRVRKAIRRGEIPGVFACRGGQYDLMVYGSSERSGASAAPEKDAAWVLPAPRLMAGA